MAPARRPEYLALQPRVLRWARERADLTDADLARKVGRTPPEVLEWERTGRLRLTVAERLAKATFTPFGALFLSHPPEESLPIADFRTVGDSPRPSPDLLDVIDEADRRATWYREFLIRNGERPLDFVGSITVDANVQQTAAHIRERIGLSDERRASASTWEAALRAELDTIEGAGVLVMRSGIVGSNTRRPLDVDEFRGFAIADEYAPLIFLNGRDSKGAQMFTAMHELVHIWLGASGVSNLEAGMPPDVPVERYSNSVAAEILAPERLVRAYWAADPTLDAAIRVMTRAFKISSLVVLRRLFDIRAIDWDTYRARYTQEEERYRREAGRGGDFYRTQQSRLSRKFASAVVSDTLEGGTTWAQAMRLLGARKPGTVRSLAGRLGYPA